MLISLPGWMPLSTRTWKRKEKVRNFILGRFVLFNHKLFSMAKRDNKVTISTSLPLENWKQSRHTMRVWSWTLISCYTLWRTFFVLSKKKKKKDLGGGRLHTPLPQGTPAAGCSMLGRRPTKAPSLERHWGGPGCFSPSQALWPGFQVGSTFPP